MAVGVKNVIVHPRWFNKAGESPGDVALLKLDRQVGKWNPNEEFFKF